MIQTADPMAPFKARSAWPTSGGQCFLKAWLMPPLWLHTAQIDEESKPQEHRCGDCSLQFLLWLSLVDWECWGHRKHLQIGRATVQLSTVFLQRHAWVQRNKPPHVSHMQRHWWGTTQLTQHDLSAHSCLRERLQECGRWRSNHRNAMLWKNKPKFIVENPSSYKFQRTLCFSQFWHDSHVSCVCRFCWTHTLLSFCNIWDRL